MIKKETEIIEYEYDNEKEEFVPVRKEVTKTKHEINFDDRPAGGFDNMKGWNGWEFQDEDNPLN